MQLSNTQHPVPTNRPSGFSVQIEGILLLALFLIALTALSVLNRKIPTCKGYVNDYANMISGPVKAKLEHTLKAFDRTDSTQIAILTVESLGGDSLEDLSVRVAKKWGIGQKEKDNGVLLLVAKKEHQVRLEVGYGLEGVLTDRLAKRIIDNIITPYFKSGQFDQGIEAGVRAVIQVTRGKFKADQRSSQRDEPLSLLLYLFLIGIFIYFLDKVSSKWGIDASDIESSSNTFGGFGGGRFGGGGASGGW